MEELVRNVTTSDNGEYVQTLEPVRQDDKIDKPQVSVPNVPIVREITVSDTFSTEKAPPPADYYVSLEFLNEETAQRRIVDVEEPVTEAKAFEISANYRQAGEILLQVIKRKKL